MYQTYNICFMHSMDATIIMTYICMEQNLRVQAVLDNITMIESLHQAELQMRGGNRDNLRDNFPYFSIKSYPQISHQNHLANTVLMRGPNILFLTQWTRISLSKGV